MVEPVDRFLSVQGRPVLSLEEFQSYAYGLDEDAVSPPTLNRWVAGGPVEPDELLACLEGSAAAAAGSSDDALEIVRLALERLRSILTDADDGQ